MEKINQKRIDPKEFVALWNIKYPYDYWWRRKHNIPFGSEEHLKANHIFMVCEFEEDKYYEEIAKRFNDNELYSSIDSEDLVKSKVINMATKDIDKEFENINLDDFNDVKN